MGLGFRLGLKASRCVAARGHAEMGPPTHPEVRGGAAAYLATARLSCPPNQELVSWFILNPAMQASTQRPRVVQDASKGRPAGSWRTLHFGFPRGSLPARCPAENLETTRRSQKIHESQRSLRST